MTWTETATPHVGHRCVLRDLRTLECVDCAVKLVLPRDPSAATPSPKPFLAGQITGRSMPAGWRERVQAEISARKRQRTSGTSVEDDGA